MNITYQTIGRHIIALGDHFETVANEIKRHVMSGPVIHFDETPLPSQAPSIGKSHSGFIWAACRDDRKWNTEAKVAACYRCDLSRGGDVPEQMLVGSSVRVLITDGHTGYKRFGNKVREGGAMVLARCMAHARRGFVKANRTSGSPFARWVLGAIKKIYKIDKGTAFRPPDERAAIRRLRILPIMNDLKLRLLEAKQVAPGKLLEAINYFLNAFDELTPLIYDGRIDFDNKPVERRIRSITLSRKNSGGAGRAEYGRTWATFLTLIETCELNGIDGGRYLHWAAHEIKRTRGNIDPVLLLPWNCPTGQIKI